jgi:hypothetical protein
MARDLVPADLGGGAERVAAVFATANYFRVLGVHLAAGAGFAPDGPTSPEPVVVIGHSLWLAHFDGSRKRRFFQRGGVPEYWVVDPDARLIERWRPGDERPELADGRFAWSPPDAAEQLDIEELKPKATASSLGEQFSRFAAPPSRNHFDRVSRPRAY